jgi:hypothetical protein
VDNYRRLCLHKKLNCNIILELIKLKKGIKIMTTTIPNITKVSLELKSVATKLDISNALADTYSEYMHCELACMPVIIKGTVLVGETLKDAEFLPVNVTEAGRWTLENYCQRMGWDLLATIDEIKKAFKQEMADA